MTFETVMDNQEAAIQTAATRLGATLKVKQLEAINGFHLRE